jgi:SAM-dependent methyltransferase
VRVDFLESVLNALVSEGALRRSDAVVAVCAGTTERDLFLRLGFRDVLITNVDDRMSDGGTFAPFEWSRQDAQDLDLGDGSFDFAFVADGLHHCSSPHRALLEMYRVARKGIVVVEARDSVLMRTANRLGLSPAYEVEAVVGNEFRWGGVDNRPIPNYVYRWTESEFKKTIRSFDPIGEHRFRFFYALNLPYYLAEMRKSSVKLQVTRAAEPVLRAFTRVFRKQCNALAMVALKPRVPDDLWPWLAVERGQVVFNRAYARQRFKEPGAAPGEPR